jgi:hypothetical protein
MSGRNRGRCCTTYHLMQCLWSCGRGWMVVGLSTAIPCPGIVPDLLSWATCAHYEAKTRQTDARPMFSRCAISVAPSPSALLHLRLINGWLPAFSPSQVVLMHAMIDDDNGSAWHEPVVGGPGVPVPHVLAGDLRKRWLHRRWYPDRCSN